jgi:hypothetical protein
MRKRLSVKMNLRMSFPAAEGSGCRSLLGVAGKKAAKELFGDIT